MFTSVQHPVKGRFASIDNPLEEERNLIWRVVDGDRNAYEDIVLAHQKNVYNLALKMTKNGEDALDITQEAFFRAYQQLGGFRGDSKLSAWLYRLTYNLCIDFLRRQPQGKVVSLYKDNGYGNISMVEIPDMRNLLEDNVIRAEKREAILESIEKLPAKHRQVLIMREITDMSYDEIAVALKINIGTVKSRLVRARLRLANLLVENGNFPDSYRQKSYPKVTAQNHENHTLDDLCP